MRRRQHALSGAIYDVRADGDLDVTARDGTTGVVTPNGDRVDGELHRADPHPCRWSAGPQLPPRPLLDRTAAPGLDMLARVCTQDVDNPPQVQLGLEAMTTPGVLFDDHQETTPRHFHALLDEWLDR